MKKIIIMFVCIILLGVIIGSAGLPENAGQKVEIKEGKSFWYVFMEFGGSFDNMQKHIQTFIGEFFKQGLTPAGPMLGIYFNDPRRVKPEELKWNLGFEVSKDSNVAAPLQKAEFKHKTIAVYLHIGPYENLDKAHDKIARYAEDNGYKTLWPNYDKYLNNPMQVKPGELKTEVIVPLEKK